MCTFSTVNKTATAFATAAAAAGSAAAAAAAASAAAADLIFTVLNDKQQIKRRRVVF